VQAIIELLLKNRGVMSGVAATERAIRGLASVAQSASAHARNLLLAGGGAAALVVRAAAEQERAERRLEQVIRTTGGAANISAREMINHASSLQSLTGRSDDAIIGMQALLATFRNLKGDEFQRATELALDLSEVMGNDMRGAALQLGKALQDPVLGVTALRRSGISFSKSQMETIKHLVKTNQLLSAQRLVLDEVSRQVGGTAVAAANSFSGKWEILKRQVDEFSETLGGILIPDLTKLVDKLRETLIPLAEWARINAGLVVSTAKWVAGLTAAVFVLPKLISLLKGVGAALSFIAANPGLGALAAAGMAVGANVTGVRAIGRQEKAMGFKPGTFKGPFGEDDSRIVTGSNSGLNELSALRAQAGKVDTSTMSGLKTRKDLTAKAIAAADRALQENEADMMRERDTGMIQDSDLIEAKIKSMTAGSRRLLSIQSSLRDELSTIDLEIAQLAEREAEATRETEEFSEASSEATSKIEELIAALQIEAASFGKTRGEIEILKLGVASLTDEQSALIKSTADAIEQNEKFEDTQRSISDLMERSRNSLLGFGKSDIETGMMEIGLENLSDAQIRYLQAVDRGIQLMEDEKKKREDSKQATDDAAQSLRDLQDELDVLTGRKNKVDVEVRKLRERGVGEQQLSEIQALMIEREAINAANRQDSARSIVGQIESSQSLFRRTQESLAGSSSDSTQRSILSSSQNVEKSTREASERAKLGNTTLELILDEMRRFIQSGMLVGVAG